ncbi:general transcription factor 3C polypeptide 3-like [Lycodopsis pacificus]
MSGFSSELIDYLEGRITFEEFDQRRDERKATESEVSAERVEEEDAQPSTSAHVPGHIKEGVSPGVQQAFASMLGDKPEPPSSDEQQEEGEEDGFSYVDDEEDEDYKAEEEQKVRLEMEEMEKRRKRRGKGGRGRRNRKQRELEEEEDVEEDPTVGDVFALEMELNRENKKMMRERRQRSKLPRALRGLMGEANIRYARGEKEDAILMCMEIIRQAPLAYEPFSTLAMIYEDDEDMDKALQFGLIAAHLNPSDCEEWIRLAEISLEQDNIRQAIVCYSKAIKYDPTNVRYVWERSSLHMRLGEHRQCMDGYRRILSLLPMEDGEHFMQLSKDMAKSYYESNDLPSALGVIEEALERHPGLVSDDFINMAAELHIANRQYSKALQVLVQFAGVVLVKDESESGCEEPRQEERVAEETTEELSLRFGNICRSLSISIHTFSLSIGQYVQAFQTHPETPLHSLCVGLTFFHMASQKYVAKRHTLVLQGFSFLWRYVDLRGVCQESMYNLGRALHQIGLTHLAIHYYQTALTLPAQKLEGIPDDQLDLRREIAFNLSLIYQASGNMAMAHQLINTHCVV